MNADIVGYTALMRTDQERALTALRALRKDLFFPKTEEHNGSLVKSMGDGWIAEFPAVVDAVAAAISIQSSLSDNDMIKLRVGLHIGDVSFEGEDVFGDGVNVASRLEELAEPGQVLLSDPAYQTLDAKSQGQFGQGSYRNLKGVKDPLKVWSWPLDEVSSDITSTIKYGNETRKLPIVAVLPFENMSDGQEQEYFADGITEEIITALSRNLSIKVLARNATQGFKGKSVDPLELGQKLNANYMLEGSVRRSGEQLRVTAQLIKTKDGTHLWAERYDRNMTDVFAIQDEITASIAGAIGVEFSRRTAIRSIRKPLENADVYDLYHKASYHYFRFTREDAWESIRLAEKAVSLAPSFAGGYCVSSIAYRLLTEMHITDEYEETLAKVLSYAQQAVAVDPTFPHSLQCLAVTESRLGNADRALNAIQKVLLMDPYRDVAHIQLAQILSQANRFEEALDAIEKAKSLNPHHYSTWYGIIETTILFGLQRFDEALIVSDNTMMTFPQSSYLYAYQAAIHALCGRQDEAQAALAECLRRAPNLTQTRILRAGPYLKNRNRNEFFEGLRIAGLPE